MKHTVWSGVGRVEDTQRVHLAHLFPSIDCTQTRCGRRGQGSFGSRRRRRVCSVLTAVAWTAVASQNSRHAMAATCAYLKCGSHKIISFAYGPIEIRSRFSLLQDALGPKSGRVIVHVASPGESVADEVDELLAVLAPGTAGTRFIRVARLRSSSKGQPAWLQSIGFAPSSAWCWIEQAVCEHRSCVRHSAHHRACPLVHAALVWCQDGAPQSTLSFQSESETELESLEPRIRRWLRHSRVGFGVGFLSRALLATDA